MSATLPTTLLIHCRRCGTPYFDQQIRNLQDAAIADFEAAVRCRTCRGWT